MARKSDDATFWLPGFESAAGAAVVAEPEDAAARERALDPTRSFIVQAPAGSGKTELLIQRYLALLARVNEPESVVAITFTIKAAGEMRSRVLESMRRASGPEPSAAHDRRTWQLARAALGRDQEAGWNLLENPGRMRIQTIDALSMAIAGQMPWLARFGAMPEVTDKPQEMYERAANEILKLLSGEDRAAEAVAALLRHVDNNAVYARKLLARMLEIRDHWLRVIGASPDVSSARESLESTLREIVADHLRRLCSAAPADLRRELVELARYAAANVAPDHALASCRDLNSLPGSAPEDAALWSGIRALLLTEKGDPRKGVNVRCGFPPRDTLMKRRWEAVAARAAGAPGFLDQLRGLDELPPVRYSDSQWRVLEALFTLLPLAAAQLRVVFSETGVVDFTEIAQAARRALSAGGQPTDLALTMGARIEHLLVDEFQDTSVTQYELLRALTAGWEPGDGRTLFLVGDPMQSIYRFRQAEVGLFLKIREAGLGAVQPESLRLTTNFRSSRKVVEWVNQAFAPIFPEREDPYTRAAPYAASTPWDRSQDGGVAIHAMAERDDGAEADLVLRIIESTRRETPRAKIAILVRARTHLPAIAAALRAREVRFRAIEIDALGERPAVHDLLSLTRALLHLGDRTAWLAVLRAPWCGLTLDDLHAIAAPRHDVAIWDALNRPGLTLSADGAARLDRVRPVLARALAARGRVHPRTLVERTWFALGGPECVASDADIDDARAFFDLLNSTDIEDFELLERRTRELFAAPDPAADGLLELMTIHKAKGLEFDCVILPGLGRRGRVDDPELLVWTERPSAAGAEVLLAPMSPQRGDADGIARYITRQERVECHHETVRLLYVAATRARRCLHLIGHAEGEPPRDTLLARLWPAVRDEFSRVAQPSAGEAPPDDRALQAQACATLRRVPAGWRPDPPPAPLPITRSRTPVESDSGEESAQNAAWRFAGTLAHSLFDRIARDGIGAWPESRIRAIRPAIGAALASMGAPPSDIDEAVNAIETALVNTLADPRGRWILAPHEDARSELQLTGALAGAAAHFAIDRTFVADGVRWIVDFKLSPQAESSPYQAQLERYARLVGEIDSRPVRLGLYFPLRPAWIEWSPE